MTNRKQFQFFPFHLVDMSPWPILTSFSAFLMAISAVMSFHGFANGGKLLFLGFILTASVMILWFKDVITEGRVKNFNIKTSFLSRLLALTLVRSSLISFYSCLSLRPCLKFTTFNYPALINLLTYRIITNEPKVAGRAVLSLSRLETFESWNRNLNFNNNLYLSVAIPKETVLEFVDTTNDLARGLLSNDQWGYYLAGLLEGDGHISLPSIGKSTLNRVLNPRIVFTSHSNNLKLYANIQYRLGGIGRFQLESGNVIRYIIGDIKGIQLFNNLIHGKLRTPKNKRFNQLIEFINIKYSLNLSESCLDLSAVYNRSSNYWFTGFTSEAGGWTFRGKNCRI
jgi:hypothetical protein